MGLKNQIKQTNKQILEKSQFPAVPFDDSHMQSDFQVTVCCEVYFQIMFGS